MSTKNIKVFDQTGCLSEEALTEYAHGKLDIHLRKQVEIHVNECDFCRDALEGISLMKSKATTQLAVAELNAKISGKGIVEQSGGKVIQMNFLRLAAAVLLFFVLGGGVLYLALNPPFKNQVALNKPEEKVLAENKATAKNNGVITDSMVTNEFIIKPDQNGSVVSELSTDDEQQNEQIKTITTVPVAGTGETPAVTKVAEDLNAEDFNKMTATGGASNAAPAYYSPQQETKEQPMLFDSDSYVADDVSANVDAEETKALTSVEITSKGKSANNKAQKDLEKKKREEVITKTAAVAEEAAAYDDLNVATEKKQIEQSRTNVVDETGSKEADTKVYAFADEMPQYPGGNDALKKHIRDNIRYPQAAKDQAVSGTVYISYVVNAAGKVTNVKVWKSVSKDLDNEAVRVVSSLKDFTPGKQGGKQVSVQMTIPVKFSLE